MDIFEIYRRIVGEDASYVRVSFPWPTMNSGKRFSMAGIFDIPAAK
jgi:hypothetical protein